MKKYIIREIDPENMNTLDYFDDDGFNEKGGDYNYTLFLISHDRYNRDSGLNYDEYKRIKNILENIFDGFYDVENKNSNETYKSIMKAYNIKYNSATCHKLKTLYELIKLNNDRISDSHIAHYLTIITGKLWKANIYRGYDQGDVITGIYCTNSYTDKQANICADIWLGCCKEFSLTELDNNGEETNTICGYYIADCQIRNEQDYKTEFCKMEGIDPDETTLELIDNYYTTKHYNYKDV